MSIEQRIQFGESELTSDCEGQPDETDDLKLKRLNDENQRLKEENDKLKRLMERGEINGNLVNAASTMSPDSKKVFYYESFIFELIKTNDLLSLCYFHVMLININISF